jgi:hypothetical protein
MTPSDYGAHCRRTRSRRRSLGKAVIGKPGREYPVQWPLPSVDAFSGCTECAKRRSRPLQICRKTGAPEEIRTPVPQVQQRPKASAKSGRTRAARIPQNGARRRETIDKYEQLCCSELTGIQARLERCCGDLGTVQASSLGPALPGDLPGGAEEVRRMASRKPQRIP